MFNTQLETFLNNVLRVLLPAKRGFHVAQTYLVQYAAATVLSFVAFVYLFICQNCTFRLHIFIAMLDGRYYD